MKKVLFVFYIFGLFENGRSFIPSTLNKNQNLFQFSRLHSENPNNEENNNEPMFSISYDLLENPNQQTLERDLEDMLMERSLRFYDQSIVKNDEMCYLVGLEDKSSTNYADRSRFTLEESLTELSELAGAAGLSVVGSTYQRVQKPSTEYYIGQGKAKDILKSMTKLKCTCVIFDAELTPSQQKNLEMSFNQLQQKGGGNKKSIKVIDRTALILDIFAQHAKTKEGQLQVQLALLTYRLPRLTNMWTHLERQSASSKGRSNGGVGLRGPGEKQLESDRRQMKSKISLLKKAINSVRTHRSRHRQRRRQLGVPVIALVGYTNSGKSTLLNSLTERGGVFVADMLFATLDPTTRMVKVPGLKTPDLLVTDTVGFIQKLPTNLVAAFRATLEEINEADILVHVTDITNEAWRKQEAAVLTELDSMGLSDKPVVTVWNKIDEVPERKEFVKLEATKRPLTVATSAISGEGLTELMGVLEQSLSSEMEKMSCLFPYDHSSLMHSLHRLAIIDEVKYLDESILVRFNAPKFLCQQIRTVAEQQRQLLEDEAKFNTWGGLSDPSNADMNKENIENADNDWRKGLANETTGSRIIVLNENDEDEMAEYEGEEEGKERIDWVSLAKGRHSAKDKYPMRQSSGQNKKRKNSMDLVPGRNRKNPGNVSNKK